MIRILLTAGILWNAYAHTRIGFGTVFEALIAQILVARAIWEI